MSGLFEVLGAFNWGLFVGIMTFGIFAGLSLGGSRGDE